MDRRRVVAVVLAVVLVSLVAGAWAGPDRPDESGQPPADRLVQPVDNGSYLWPYTSRERSVEGRTLPINVVVAGDADRVRRILLHESDVNWTSVENDTAVAESPWRHASGAVRYSYVGEDSNGSGQWVDAGYQIGVGSHFGTRIHVRAYPAASTEWTAMQAHTEYWDWFRLRHTVTSTSAGAEYVERDLRDQPVRTELHREYHGVGGSSDSGWLSLIELAPAAGVLFATRRELRDRATSLFASEPEFRDRASSLLLPVSLVALVVGVRLGGIAVGSVLSGTNPKLIAGALYPVLALGPLVATYYLAPERPVRAAALAAAGLGLAVWIDLALVDVAAVPVRLALHRVALVGALAAFAVGAGKRDGRVMGLGALAWGLVLALPLAAVV